MRNSLMAMNFQEDASSGGRAGAIRATGAEGPLETVLGGLSPARAVDDPSAPRDRRRERSGSEFW